MHVVLMHTVTIQGRKMVSMLWKRNKRLKIASFAASVNIFPTLLELLEKGNMAYGLANYETRVLKK
jgi:hypothetical protein